MKQTRPKRGGDILIIDNTPDNLEVLTRIMTQHGCQTRTRTTAQSGWSAALEALPDLILLDIGLPDADGFTLCRRFKGDPLFADVPIIFISPFDDIESKVKGFEAGAVDCIPKPFHHDEVIARVQSQLALKYLRQQEQELAVLRERQRIARDLHNAVSQTLLSAGLMIDRLIAHGGHDLFTEQTLLRLADLSRSAAAEIRTILYEPRPEALAGVDLADPLAGAYAGTLVMPPEAKAASQRGDPLEHDTLTERERRILSLMVQGLNNNEIAQRVLFSRATVKASVSMILEKLGARTRVEAVAIALKRGLVDDQRG